MIKIENEQRITIKLNRQLERIANEQDKNGKDVDKNAD